ncbi:MAG: hypothetical protein FWB74_09050, partial [Defluviitaleaceae bacterium]|nr:hypothetical protein [Defluviitaleaceae bacterium]
FRSREALAHDRVTILSDHFGGNTGQDLPAASFAFLSKVRAGEDVIIDLAGGTHGLKMLSYCYDAIISTKYEFLCVLNLFRPETNSADKMLDYIQRVNALTKLSITGLVNNGNMLRDTTPDHILSSQAAVLAACQTIGVPLRYSLIQAELYKGMKSMVQSDNVILFNKLQMRESWQ